MSGPPFPLQQPGSNAIGKFTIGVSPIGDIPLFSIWSSIISQYANSPIITQLIQNMDTYIDQTADVDAFFDNIMNIDTATGYGLDLWGRILGVPRTLTVQTGKNLGFAQASPTVDPFGVSPFFSGTLLNNNFALSDTSYRKLLLAKALANITTGTIPALNQILINLFPMQGNAFATDVASITNLTPQSNGFGTFPWGVNNAIITPNSGISPDGTNDAFLFQRTATASSFLGREDLFPLKPPVQQPFTYSLHAKPGTGNFLALFVGDTDGASFVEATFNVATGVVSNGPLINNSVTHLPFLNATASIQPAANGFFRCSLSFISSNDNKLRPYFNGNSNNSLMLAPDTSSSTTLLVFGAQLEASPVAGIYVPTTTSPVTQVTPLPMSMTYTFNFILQPVDASIVTSSGVLPRPCGVAQSIVQL